MAAGEIHVGDVGTVINFTIKDEDEAVVDISAATLTQLYILRPNATSVTRTMNFETNGSDGRLTYTSVSGDFSVPGIYRLQSYIYISDDEKYKTDVNSVKIYPNIG